MLISAQLIVLLRLSPKYIKTTSPKERTKSNLFLALGDVLGGPPGDTGFHLSVTFKAPCMHRHRPKTMTAKFSNPASHRPFCPTEAEDVVRVVSLMAKMWERKSTPQPQMLHHPFKSISSVKSFGTCSCTSQRGEGNTTLTNHDMGVHCTRTQACDTQHTQH